MTAPDWPALTRHITARLVESVHALHAEHPDHRIYGAATHAFSGETGGVVYWPAIAVASEEDLAESAAGSGFEAGELRWSPADWEFQVDPDEADDAWAARVEASAREGDDEHWEATYARYLRAFADAAKTARRQLVADGIVPRDFIAVAMDEAWELLPLSLTTAQLDRHFPELGEEAQELARLAALPEAERAAELADLVESSAPTVVSSEEAVRQLRGLGEASVEIALQRMPRSQRRWQWAKLLADVGIARDDVTEALTAVMRGRRLPEPDRAWAAAALARLGRMHLVAADAERLPRTVLLRGLAAPYTSFRDHAATRLPLDYAPLEAALTAHPELAEEMLGALAPGSGYCTLEPAEVGTATAALASPFEVVRRHAAIVLEDATPDAARRARAERT